MGKEAETAALIFTYGTLKRGFSNHVLLQDMMATGDASFVGSYRTRARLPLVCGPYRVPFLINLPGCGQRVSGELYAVSNHALERMDELEGVRRGHYERLAIDVVRINKDKDDDDDDDDGNWNQKKVSAQAYYAHRSYAEELWKKNGKEGYNCYSEKVARGYVKRKDRPQSLTFLDQIGLFLSGAANVHSADAQRVA